MSKLNRVISVLLTFGLLTSMGTVPSNAAPFVSNSNTVVSEIGGSVQLADLTGQNCESDCSWAVNDFSGSSINWSVGAGEASGTTNRAGHFDVELRGTKTETVDGNSIVTDTYSTIYRINVLENQTVSIDSIADHALSERTTTAHASASSRLAITYSSQTPATCSVDSASGLVTFIAAGECSIEATQPGNDYNWNDADADTEFTILKDQEINFPSIPDYYISQATITVSATSTSGLPVTFTASGTCSINSSTGVITFNSIGNCAITAAQDGNDVWAEAEEVSRTFTILPNYLPPVKGDQTITLTTPATQVYSPGKTVSVTPVTLYPAEPIGRPVTYSASPSNVCTVDNAGTVSLLAIGICYVTGAQAGTEELNPTQSTVNFEITDKKTQLITFHNPGNQLLGVLPFTINASAASGLPVSFTSNTTSVCTVDGAGLVRILTTGICKITASQGGNSEWAAAPSVPQEFVITSAERLSNIISFNESLNNRVLSSGTFSLNATASSGLAVRYTSNSLGVCSVNSDGSVVTLIATGTCSITALQDGNGSYPAATSVTRTFEVIPQTATVSQVINLVNPSQKTLGVSPNFFLGGSATSGLTVTYLSSTPGICEVDGAGFVQILSTGTCLITANQPGNGTYTPAPSVIVSFLIVAPEVGPSVVTPTPITPKVVTPPVITLNGAVTTYNGSPQGLSVTAGTASCTLTYNGARSVPVNAGTYSVVAKCTENGATSTATAVLVINKAKPTIEWFDPASITTTTKLTTTQLNATSRVNGKFVYSPAAGVTLEEGVKPLATVFTPRDTRNYESATANVNIVVTRTKLQTIVIPFDLGSSSLTSATKSILSKIKASGASSITILGYVKPSKSLTADQTLSLARANQVRTAIMKLMPKIKISVVAMDRTRNPLCDFAENKCAVITE